MSNDDARYVRLDERIKGMAASTAILNETGRQERGRLRDQLEQQRERLLDIDKQLQRVPSKSEITDLRLAINSLQKDQASSTQVRVALIGAGGAIVTAVVALLRVLIGG